MKVECKNNEMTITYKYKSHRNQIPSKYKSRKSLEFTEKKVSPNKKHRLHKYTTYLIFNDSFSYKIYYG